MMQSFNITLSNDVTYKSSLKGASDSRNHYKHPRNLQELQYKEMHLSSMARNTTQAHYGPFFTKEAWTLAY